MADLGVPTGIKKLILNLLNDDPNVLWSISEIMKELKLEKTPVDNSLRTCRINGLVSRHKDKDINGEYQYAITISSNNIEPYSSQPTNKRSNSGNRNKSLLTSKEIRSMFAVNYNNMAKLEDAVLKIIELYEEQEKEMTKIRNFIGKK